MAADNPFRFSTKYWDSDTKQAYYGHRYYGSGIGRWLSKDPIQENGGENQFEFINNNPINIIDQLGLHEIKFDAKPIVPVPYPIKTHRGDASGQVKIDVWYHSSPCKCVIQQSPKKYSFNLILKLTLTTQVTMMGVRNDKGEKRTKEGVSNDESHEQNHWAGFEKEFNKYKKMYEPYLNSLWNSNEECEIIIAPIRDTINTQWPIYQRSEENEQGEHWDKWRKEHIPNYIW